MERRVIYFKHSNLKTKNQRLSILLNFMGALFVINAEGGRYNIKGKEKSYMYVTGLRKISNNVCANKNLLSLINK